MVTQILKTFVISLGLSVLSQHAIAQVSAPSNHERLKQDTIRNVKSKLSPLLTKYCKSSCEVINVVVDVEEAIGEVDNLGFEGVDGTNLAENIFVSKIAVEIQIDNRITSQNRNRLGSILENNIRNFGGVSEIIWMPVTIPQIGQSAANEAQLKNRIENRIAKAIDSVIKGYCPETCVLAQIAVDGELITPDEAADLSSREIVRAQGGDGILRLDSIDVEVVIDESIDLDLRSQIRSMMEAKTRFAKPVNLDIQVTNFPESYNSKRQKQLAESSDPYGLEKLRKTLEIFRDLASTKEIVTNSVLESKSTANNERTQKLESQSNSVSDNSSSTNSENSEKIEPYEWFLYSGCLLLLLGLLVFVIRKWSHANRDARLMMEHAGSPYATQGGLNAAGEDRGGVGSVNGNGGDLRGNLALRMKCQELRDELIKIFLEAPKIAKETFSRLIQEEGIEETSKYVHLFGHLVVFELLDDPNLQRDLYELSEYYHKTEFDFTTDEELQLLQRLKTKVTANEIRVLSRKRSGHFDFLLKLAASQIFNLITEEKPAIQSIVLTQLDHKRRRAVFDMFDGEPKVELMKELCRADAIPKEFLLNVAQALHKKVTSRPEFDTENLRSSDILLDLLEKAALNEQRALMANLMSTNPEAARGIKLKLVTLEMLPYLKDGQLLEITLGIERQDLLCFLSGVRDDIRDLLISKAPEELADSWLEDLDNVQGFDEQNYKLVEMKVLGRIRSLANNGAINLLDINDMIFGTAEEVSEQGNDSSEVVGVASNASMVA